MNTKNDHPESIAALEQQARELLTRSGNCAQTSFAVLQDAFDLPESGILKALTPFPGIALRGETCGAVIGSLMALGLVFGRDDLDDWKGYIASLPSSRKFCHRFVDQHGSTTCAQLLESRLGQPFNLADRAETMAYVTAGGPQVCADIVASAVSIAANILESR